MLDQSYLPGARAGEGFWQSLTERLVVPLPIGDWFTAVVGYMQDHFEWFFELVSTVIGFVADELMTLFNWIPAPLVFLLLAAIALWRVGWQFTIFVLIALYVVLGMDLWPATMDTLGLVLAATVAALGIGLPLGVAMAKSNIMQAIIRPVLDFMQTLPAFVYLIPAVIFFGTGRVPGVIATVIFAMPPAVRLTSLGIRQVNKEIVEAGQSFGCTSRQLLFKVQLPNAMPSIMAGVNQTIMMALSMVIIASMVGAGGLGNDVLASIQRLDIGLGFESGMAVVLLAIILDRITESFGTPQTNKRGIVAWFSGKLQRQST